MKLARKKAIRNWMLDRVNEASGQSEKKCTQNNKQLLDALGIASMAAASKLFTRGPNGVKLRPIQPPKHSTQNLFVLDRVHGKCAVGSDAFLMTYEWRRVRMMALKKYGARCQCCGASPADGAVMNVDHIKPRKLFPALALDVGNLQVMCAACNHGKGNWDMTDWRQSHEEPVDPEVAAFIRSIARDTTR